MLKPFLTVTVTLLFSMTNGPAQWRFGNDAPSSDRRGHVKSPAARKSDPLPDDGPAMSDSLTAGDLIGLLLPIVAAGTTIRPSRDCRMRPAVGPFFVPLSPPSRLPCRLVGVPIHLLGHRSGAVEAIKRSPGHGLRGLAFAPRRFKAPRLSPRRRERIPRTCPS